MATASGLKICPDCKGELPIPIPEFCPHCSTNTAFRNERNRQAAEARTQHRWQVKSLFEQCLKEVNDLERKPKDDLGKKNEPTDRLELIKEMHSQYKLLPFQQKLSVLTDALNIMRLSLHSGLTGEEIKSLVDLGEKIGASAAAVSAFIKVNGVV